MKTVKLTFLLILFSPVIFSQQLTGLWMGELVNDSTKKKQHFELALSEYRGKVTGYSYTTFIENDRYFYSIKRIKASQEDSTWIIEDDKMIVNNFPEKAAKGVRQTSTFTLNKKDSSWQMKGHWKTNQTKTYYSLYGSLQMDEEKDFTKSNLIPHLNDLSLQNTVTFYQPEKLLTSMGQIRAHKTEIAPGKINPSSLKNNDVAETNVPAIANLTLASGNNQEKMIEGTNESAPLIAGRSAEIIQTVLFKSDSLVLSLYDNGEIDGDTVSVYLDKEQILSKELLKASAIKKTIYFSAQTPDSFQLILFAENLGKFPPNTGLLIIRDGEDVHQIRFSADLQRSPSILFRRKAKE